MLAPTLTPLEMAIALTYIIPLNACMMVVIVVHLIRRQLSSIMESAMAGFTTLKHVIMMAENAKPLTCNILIALLRSYLSKWM